MRYLSELEFFLQRNQIRYVAFVDLSYNEIYIYFFTGKRLIHFIILVTVYTSGFCVRASMVLRCILGDVGTA
jgi:hypothetical protein